MGEGQLGIGDTRSEREELGQPWSASRSRENLGWNGRDPCTQDGVPCSRGLSGQGRTLFRPRGAVRSRPVPTPENPYIGLVVRAIEHDESSLANRRDDYDDFVEAIRGKSQDSVDRGAVPWAEVLEAGNSVASRQQTSKMTTIGSECPARAYPDYGNEIAFDLAREDSFEPNGGYIWATSRPLDLRFLEEGAHYHLTGDLRVVTDDPAPSSP